MRIFLALLFVLSTGCSSIQQGFLLQEVAMDQPRVGLCRHYTINARSAQEIMASCGNWMGCTHFERQGQPASIWYLEGHKEILKHEVDHCIAGGPLHQASIAAAY